MKESHTVWIFTALTSQPFKRHPYKMLKRTQTVRRVLQTNCLSLFEHFVGFALKRLK